MSKPAKFNWLTTLRRLAKRKTPITGREHGALKRRSGAWPTCACGQLCRRLPRGILGIGNPTDGELFWLGIGFNAQVKTRQWKEALATFLRIEARTTLLLKQMADRRGRWQREC